MQEMTAEDSAKHKVMMEAENERRYTAVDVPPQPRQAQKPTFNSEQDAERAALRALKWLKKNPTAKVSDVPGHIREKLAIARHMMDIGS